MYNCVSLPISNKQGQQAETRVARLASGARAERLRDERERKKERPADGEAVEAACQ